MGKKSLGGFNSRSELTEERTSELEVWQIETIYFKGQKEKGIKNSERSLTRLRTPLRMAAYT